MPSHRESPVRTLHGTIVRETDKAILFTPTSIGGVKTKSNGSHWFPLSQISKLMRTHKKGEDWIIVSEWIIEQKKLNFTPEEVLDGNVNEPSPTELEDTDPPDEEDLEDVYDRMNKGM